MKAARIQLYGQKFDRVFSKITKLAVIAGVSGLLSLVPLGVAHAGSPGSIDSWTTEPNGLPQAQNQFAAVVENGYVYSLGGSTSGSGSAVFYASLNSDGSVGTWTTSPNSLPQNNFRLTSTAYNNHIYAIAGRNGPALDTIYSAPVSPTDGSVGAWTTETNHLPAGLYYLNSFVYNGYLYVLGGDNNSNAVDTVYSAPLNSDGSVGTWTLSPNALPEQMEQAAVVTYDDYAYLIGGWTYADGSLDSVYSAPLGADGAIGIWTASPNSLPQAVSAASFTEFNGYVFIAGGDHYDGSDHILNTVYSAPLSSDGSIGTWTTSANTLPQALQFPASVSYNGVMYVLGGTIGGFGFVNTVYSTRLTGNPVSPSPSPGGTNSTGQHGCGHERRRSRCP